MIEIRNLWVKYKNQNVIKNFSLSLPNNGLIAIVGPSGSGKTTLLNALSGLLDYKGIININGKDLKSLNEDELALFRLKNFGFIFQDFKLFDNETIKRNILFPLSVLSNDKKVKLEQKCLDLCQIVNLKNNINQNVLELSGGQKQRAAIARALANNPKIILADEPTGSLDSLTREDIMLILEKIAHKSLILLVTHDLDIAKRYADRIISLKDGKLFNDFYQEKCERNVYIPLCKNRKTNKKPSIPFDFLFRHSLASIKRRKWRSVITNGVISFSLLGIGLAINLSSSISANIKSIYSSMVDDTSIIVTPKKRDNLYYDKVAPNYSEIIDLTEPIKNYIDGIGVYYSSNFENNFSDLNEATFSNGQVTKRLNDFDIREINEYKWLEEAETIYPRKISLLENDEIVLGLTYRHIQEMCFVFNIDKSIDSLSNYIANNNVTICFKVNNDDWQYSNEHLLKVKGFTLESNICLYHSNYFWNEEILENQFRFPIDDNLSNVNPYPWTLDKIYYLKINERDNFFRLTLEDKILSGYLFELATINDYPHLYRDSEKQDIDRIFVYSNTLSRLSPYLVSCFNKVNENLINPIYGSSGGYAIYSESLLQGFAKEMLFASTSSDLESAINASSIISDTSSTFSYPDNVASGHFSESMTGGVIFRSSFDELISGTSPQSYDEIALSSALAKKLFGKTNVIGERLHVGYIVQEKVNGKGETVRYFNTQEILITGIVSSNKLALYHDSFWSILFFQTRLGVSIFDLIIDTVSFNYQQDEITENEINKLNKAFPEYEFTNPLFDVSESVDQVCFYLEIALIIFSGIALIISIFLLIIGSYLHVLESTRDIALSRCLGVSKREARKFVLSNALLTSFIAFILGAIELLIVTILFSYSLSSIFNASFVFTFNPLSILAMFLTSFLISLLSALSLSKKVNKINPILAMKI